MPTELALTLIWSLPFLAAVIAMAMPAGARNGEAWLAGTVAAVGLVLTILLFPQVADGGVVHSTITWMPAYGLDLAFRMDGLAWLFCVLVTFIGLLVVLYARYYMSPKDPIARFYALFLAFMGAMLGLVMSGNIIQLAIFWELTSLVSFLLIGYWYHRSDARDGARMALVITGTGGLALFVAMMLIGHIVGSYDIDVVLASGRLIAEHPLYPVTLILFLLAAFTKSAQFPFQFWLPNAMTAPTPVSAYLHSATMVKAGVFLMTRFWPVMAGTDMWFWIVTYGGLATLLFGAYAALFQRDLKGLLAYSTISHLGLITTLLGMGTPLAAVAAIFHIANHATFKASLFMAVGIIDHETGTRDVRKLSGLRRSMPFTATLAIIASGAMAGVPLLNGFLSKEMFFTETAIYDPNVFVNLSLPIVATLAGMLSVAYSIKFVHGVFFGPEPTGLEKTPHEPPALMRRPIELLVLACLAVGIIPGITIGPYLAAAVVSVLGGDTPYYSLSVWHGFNLPLIMSIIALLGGVAIYVPYYRRLRGIDGDPLLRGLRGQRIFERLLITATNRWARKMVSVFGTQRLQPQIFIVVLLALAAGVGAGWARMGNLPLPSSFDPVLGLVWIVGGVSALAAAWQAKFHRLAAMILMGGAGLATCITFAWFSAPDLALTQLLAEIATTVLILLGLRWLPKRLPVPEDISIGMRLRRYRDVILAAAVGLGTGLASYAIMTRQAPEGISEFFLANAYTEGGGTNVVNVMLVDFRGFDTLGEITVLGVVALTVFGLLRRFRPAPDSADRPEQQRVQADFAEAQGSANVAADFLRIPALIMNWMFPVVMTVAIYMFLRGHDLPGGGFIAGIVMSLGFILQYMAGGTRWVEDRLRILPVLWIGWGLLIALLTGLGAMALGFPFLTSAFAYADIPLIGKVPMATALLFDLGVFALVVGATVLMLIALAHQSIRRPKPASTPQPRKREGLDTWN
ncbi:multicomponent K+:H+ antiporter subunit A [Devosia enhydra]|uniref:Multicomponent K+:H+ antiporter subunit A n=1 Tax=Devosia enhydra TaxID=665118 RepID=A0A1K2I090_9HYPH|nr:monovalent cation/H+ antiporter subunit A [Devosia enhydra]SFZ85695.1 multicomponent K+:H+ antiporter subunit A [Devosia enhydra]